MATDHARAEHISPLPEVIGECEHNADSAEWAYAMIFSDAAYWLRTLVAERDEARREADDLAIELCDLDGYLKQWKAAAEAAEAALARGDELLSMCGRKLEAAEAERDKALRGVLAGTAARDLGRRNVELQAINAQVVRRAEAAEAALVEARQDTADVIAAYGSACTERDALAAALREISNAGASVFDGSVSSWDLQDIARIALGRVSPSTQADVADQ